MCQRRHRVRDQAVVQVRARDADDGVAADVVVAGGDGVVDRAVLDLDVVRVVAGSATGFIRLAGLVKADPAPRQVQLIKWRRAGARSACAMVDR